jgi:2-dehydropantoate 2-reductase
MRILILGAGALGGYFGARLIAAGRDVTFLARPRSAQQLAANGLRVLSPTHGDLWIEHPQVVEMHQIAVPYDLVLLSCKSYDLDASIASVESAVGANSAVLPMLNGLAHMGALDAAFGAERVLGGTCFISAVRDSDGTIRHLNNRDGLYYGHRTAPASDQMHRIDAALSHAGFHGILRPVILQDMWEKWSFLATLAGVTCGMRATLGDVERVDPTLAARMYAECCAIAEAEGFSPGADFRDLHRRILTTPGSGMTASMLRDLEDGAPVESHQILGDLLERGLRHGLSSPLLALAHTHVRCYEERRIREAAIR